MVFKGNVSFKLAMVLTIFFTCLCCFVKVSESLNCECAHGNLTTINGTSSCVCNVGWTGFLCDACADHFFGANCDACTCLTENSVCDDGLEGEGSCSCVNGWHGTNCDQQYSDSVKTSVISGKISVHFGFLI